MSDFGDISGVHSEKGYYYQKLIAIYYLIVEEAREIEYEVDGQDFSILNENPDRDSVEYVQVKCLSTGSFTFSKFQKDVFPQLWNAYSLSLEKKSDKAIYCTLVTNICWDDSFKRFCQGCLFIRKRGLLLSQFEASMKRHIRIYNKIKGTKDRGEFNRFLWGFNAIHSFTAENVESKILEYMRSSGVREARTELAKIIKFFSERGQGRITRRQIEELIKYNLVPTRGIVEKPSYPEFKVRESLLNLEITRNKYRVEGDCIDEEGLLREMTFPVKKASNIINSYLEQKRGTFNFSIENVDEACQIISSDAGKAIEEAGYIVKLKNELWIREKKYDQRIISIQKTVGSFGINWGDEEYEG